MGPRASTLNEWCLAQMDSSNSFRAPFHGRYFTTSLRLKESQLSSSGQQRAGDGARESRKIREFLRAQGAPPGRGSGKNRELFEMARYKTSDRCMAKVSAGTWFE